MPAVTPVPKFSIGPAIQTPIPMVTEVPLAPQTQEPAPECVTDATPEPALQTGEPAPEWQTEVTPVPELQTEEPAPDWLTGATTEPAEEATEVPVPEPVPQTEEPAPDWLTEVTSEPAAKATVAPSPDIVAAPTEAPYVAPGLAGKWQAKDATGTRIILLTPEGMIEISHEEVELADRAKKGTFTSSADMIVITYEDGAVETFRYILMGDNLLLSDENLQNPVSYVRQHAED